MPPKARKAGDTSARKAGDTSARGKSGDTSSRSKAKKKSPVKKKAGKPMMTRSLPPSRKKKIVKPQIDPEEAALMEFLATDF